MRRGAEPFSPHRAPGSQRYMKTGRRSVLRQKTIENVTEKEIFRQDQSTSRKIKDNIHFTAREDFGVFSTDKEG